LHYLESKNRFFYLLSLFFSFRCRLRVEDLLRVTNQLHLANEASTLDDPKNALVLLTAELSKEFREKEIGQPDELKNRSEDAPSCGGTACVHDARHSATIYVSIIHILQPGLETLSAFTLVSINILSRLPHTSYKISFKP
jgi:hypothetical protein